MSEGILNLDTGNNQQQDDTLFLSPGEQRGLEAATFGSVIGQAPATGSFFGDIFSTLAQTAPAAVATFKERQSIKEKEAEYKEKTKTSLAERIKGKFVYDTEAYNPPLIVNGQEVPQEPGANRYVSNIELAEAAELGSMRYQPVKKDNSAKNIKPYSIFRTDQDGRVTVEKAYLPYKDFLELKIKSSMEGSNVDVQPFEEVKNYFDTKTGEILPMTTTAFLEKQMNEPGRYRIDPDEAAALRIEQRRGEQKELMAGRDAVRKEYQATSELVDIYEHIAERLMAATKPGGKIIPTGVTGDAFIFLDSVSAGVSNIFQIMTQDDDFRDKRYAMAEERVNQLIARDKGIEGSLAEFVDTSTGSAGDRAQTIKSMLTQFVYAVAKSRESGGKFSVSDIDFAFMSAGRASDPKKILRGMSAVIKPLLRAKVSKARTAFRDPNSKKVLSMDELWKHPDFQTSQNVLRLHYAFEGYEMPESWGEFDTRPTYNEEKQKLKQKTDNFYQGILNEMGAE